MPACKTCIFSAIIRIWNSSLVSCFVSSSIFFWLFPHYCYSFFFELSFKHTFFSFCLFILLIAARSCGGLLIWFSSRFFFPWLDFVCLIAFFIQLCCLCFFFVAFFWSLRSLSSFKLIRNCFEYDAVNCLWRHLAKVVNGFSAIFALLWMKHKKKKSSKRARQRCHQLKFYLFNIREKILFNKNSWPNSHINLSDTHYNLIPTVQRHSSRP